MKDNKYLIMIRDKLIFTKKMIRINQSVGVSSSIEDEVYKKIPAFLKKIKHNLSSDLSSNSDDYKLYMECKELISYWTF